MPSQYTVEVGEDQAGAVSRLAHRYGITEEEVIAQLIDLGLDSIEESTV